MVDERKFEGGNAGALGFIGFGLTTTLLSLVNAGAFPSDAMMLGMIIFLGGFAEIVAACMLWRMGDTFAMTAFGAFGFFWMSLATITIAPALGLTPAGGANAVGSYLVLWGIFTAGMFLGTLKAPKAVTLLIGMLAILFLILGAGALAGNADITKIGGYWGIINGLVGIYIAVALVVNEANGKEMLPLFAPKPKKG
jgi:uncharacterized protein